MDALNCSTTTINQLPHGCLKVSESQDLFEKKPTQWKTKTKGIKKKLSKEINNSYNNNNNNNWKYGQ